MPEWAGNPLVWIICGVAVAGALLKAGMWISGVNSDRASFKAFMQRVEDKLDKISDRLPAQTVSSSSPIQLTDLGEENSASLGADGGSTRCAAAPVPIPPRIGHRHAVDYGSRSTVKGGLTVSREAP